MLSHDLENLASALEQIASEFPEEKASFLALFCANLHSLADRAENLEAAPLAGDVLMQGV